MEPRCRASTTLRAVPLPTAARQGGFELQKLLSYKVWLD